MPHFFGLPGITLRTLLDYSGLHLGEYAPNRYHLKSSRSVSCMEKLVINKCILHSVSMTELHCSLLYHKAVDHKTPVLCS